MVVVAAVSLPVLWAVADISAAVIVRVDLGEIVVSAEDVNDEFPVLLIVKVPSAECDVFFVDVQEIVSALTVKV
jgi:hypothetical protein